MTIVLKKAFEEKSHVESFKKGSIILSSLSRFRGEPSKEPGNKKKEKRSDKNEGRMDWGNHSSAASQWALLCFHDKSVDSSKYGNFFLEIKDAEALFYAIYDRISKFVITNQMEMGKVQYNKPSYDEFSRNNLNHVMYKTIDFEEDKEWRMAFCLKLVSSFEDIPGTIEFEYFKRDLIQKNPPLKITKEEYIKTKSCNYGDDLFFEIHLKGISFDSSEIFQAQPLQESKDV